MGEKKFCIFADGMLIDEEAKLVKTLEYEYCGVYSGDYYAGQKAYEQGPWGLFKNGKKLWEKKSPMHHDLILMKEKVITFDKEAHKYRGRLVDFDVIVEYNYKGDEIARWSTWDNLKKLKKHHPAFELDAPSWLLPIKLRDSPSPWGGMIDYYRLNSLHIIDVAQSDPRFAKGNWVLTMRHGSLIFVFDKKKDIVFTIKPGDVPGKLEGPHGAQLLGNGNLLIFDNGRYRGWSRVIEYNPQQKTIEWEYKADGFYSESQGYAQRLSDGRTVITESEKGRVIIVTQEGKVIWEFLHPQKQTKVNTPDYPQSWGKRKWIYRAISI